MRAVCPEESLTCRREQGAPPSGSLERGAAEMCFLFPPLSSPEGQRALTSPPPTRRDWSLAPLALPCPRCPPLLHRAPLCSCLCPGWAARPLPLCSERMGAEGRGHCGTPALAPVGLHLFVGVAGGGTLGGPGARKSSSASRANMLRTASGLW